MTRKQIAINNACIAFEDICKYKGIFYNLDTDFYIRNNTTIKEINEIAESYKRELNIPLQPATEKQINYLLILSKPYESEYKRIKESKLNKYQASQLIKIYKETESLIYSHFPISYCKETYEEISKEIDYILSCKTL